MKIQRRTAARVQARKKKTAVKPPKTTTARRVSFVEERFQDLSGFEQELELNSNASTESSAGSSTNGRRRAKKPQRFSSPLLRAHQKETGNRLLAAGGAPPATLSDASSKKKKPKPKPKPKAMKKSQQPPGSKF